VNVLPTRGAMKVDHVVAEMDRTGCGAFDYVAAERPIESEHRAGVLHREGDMIEAPNASCLLSGNRAPTAPPTTALAAATPRINLRRDDTSAMLPLQRCLYPAP
jgi:hypothetical protein